MRMGRVLLALDIFPSFTLLRSFNDSYDMILRHCNVLKIIYWFLIP